MLCYKYALQVAIIVGLRYYIVLRKINSFYPCNLSDYSILIRFVFLN